MMKIVFAMEYHPDERIGGAEVQAWLFSQEIAARGYQVYYLAQSLSGRAGSVEMINGVNVVWMKRQRFLHIFWAPWRWKLLVGLKPDIIIQRYSNWATAIYALYSLKYNKIFYWICTDDSIPVKLGGLLSAFKKSIYKSIYKRPIILFDAFIDDVSKTIGLKLASLCFVQNNFQEAQLVQNYRIEPLRIKSGHPLSGDYSIDDKLHHKIILWVGTLADHKRPELFIEFARYSKKHGFSFVMIGGHPDKMKVKKIFLNPPDNLLWLGELSFNETQHWFSRALFYLNTSAPDGDGFPNTFIQAWLSGTPVLSLCINPNNIITDNNLGIVTSEFSLLQAFILDSYKDDNTYGLLSHHVRAFAEREFSLKGAVDDFLVKINLHNVSPEKHSSSFPMSKILW